MTVVNSIETVGPCLKRLEIEIPAPDVDAETVRVVREYGRRVRLPGFRKGKVPTSLVQNRFREEIEREVVDRLIPRYWKQAQEESDLDPMLAPSVGSIELKKGEPLVFEATVEVRPQIEIKDLGNFDLPEEDVDPGEEDIDEALHRLQTQVADWVEVDRAIVRGDLVKVELQELDEDGNLGGDPKELTLEVGDERVWEEISLALLGLEPGQQTDFRRQERRQEQSADATTVRRYRTKVLQVEERDLPPIDDQLAEKAGDFENLDSLRSHLQERLRQEKEQDLGRRQEQAMLDQLRDRYPLELPERVVEEETRDLLREYAANLGRQGVDVEKAAIDWEGLAKELRPQGEKRVHIRLVLDAVSTFQQIEVESAELEKRVALLARIQGKSTPVLRQSLARSGQLDSLRTQMKREKTIARLLGREETVEEKAVEWSESEGE